jgi:hypothetical protein
MNGSSSRLEKTKKEYKFGLRSPRSANRYPKLIRLIFLGDILLRWILLVYLGVGSLLTPAPCLFSPALIWLVIVEFALSSIFLARYGRWEEHGHLITFWQVLSSSLAFAVRHSLYTKPVFFGLMLVELFVAYVVGIMTEFYANKEPRLPPFLPKRIDKETPEYGWLGPHAAGMCATELSRNLVTLVLYVTNLTRVLLVLLFCYTSVHTEMRAIGDNLDHLFYICIGFTVIGLLPNFIVDIAILPEFISDLKNGKSASKSCKTAPFEVAIIDEDNLDNLEANDGLRERLGGHSCCSITVVIPCYMPNEQEIIFDVLNYYRVQASRYPGVMKVLVVWNSPDEHYSVEEKLNDLKQEWPLFEWRRDLLSTSKCDNLNTAIEYLRTDVALLNDADTMVSAETFVRASLLITGGEESEQFDIAQCHSTHCREDVIGCPESGGFCFGPVVTMADASKPKTMATQGLFKHAPANGRGGFWRSSALKLVAFDHRSFEEGHDAAYRGIAYYGLKGILDPNMLCQEREPPDCASLTRQRIRWETAALEMRRTFPWILRSTYYSKFEAFILIWSQLYANANLPLQSMPLQIFMAIWLVVTKCFMWKHVFGGEELSWHKLCGNEDCAAHFKVHGEELALPLSFVVLLSIFFVVAVLWIFERLLRFGTTRYRPRGGFCLLSVLVAPVTMVPFFVVLPVRSFEGLLLWRCQVHCNQAVTILR